MTDWLVISSQQNLGITASLDWRMQGFKRRHRKAVARMMPDDRLVYYVTGEQKLAALTRVTAAIEEHHDPVWVNLGKDPSEDYPWRVGTEPLVILRDTTWIPLADHVAAFKYFRKWPAKHWRLGLQGQLHEFPGADSSTINRLFEQ